jgi:Uma2 family endonuclease
MASTALLTVEQYFNARFEGLEPEFVHGELVERFMPTLMHGWLQSLLIIRLRIAGFPVTAVRMRLAPDIIRIPDIALYTGSLPEDQVPAQPPLAVVEITSPDDRHTEVLRKLEEYREWRVQHIWVVEPELKQFHVYDSRGLVQVNEFELPALGFRVTAEELFREATAR